MLSGIISVPDALSQLELPPGDGFLWAAGEASLAKALYAWAAEERKHPTEWVKVAEYWRRSEMRVSCSSR